MVWVWLWDIPNTATIQRFESKHVPELNAIIPQPRAPTLGLDGGLYPGCVRARVKVLEGDQGGVGGVHGLKEGKGSPYNKIIIK